MDPFATLNLPATGATEATVKRAYHELARRYHPDRAGSSKMEEMKRINTAYNYIIANKLYTKEPSTNLDSREAISVNRTHSKPSFGPSTVNGFDYTHQRTASPFSCPWCQSTSICTCQSEIDLYQNSDQQVRFNEIFSRLQIYVRWSRSFSKNSSIETRREWDEHRMSRRLQALLRLWQRDVVPDWRDRLCLFIARILYDCHKISEAITSQQGYAQPLRFTVNDFLNHSGIEELLNSYEKGLVGEAWSFLEQKPKTVVQQETVHL